MDQSLVGDFTGQICVGQEINLSLGFLPAALAEGQGNRHFVAVVKSRDELLRGLRELSEACSGSRQPLGKERSTLFPVEPSAIFQHGLTKELSGKPQCR